MKIIKRSYKLGRDILFMTKVCSTMVSKNIRLLWLCVKHLYVRLKKYKFAPVNNNDYKPLSK